MDLWKVACFAIHRLIGSVGLNLTSLSNLLTFGLRFVLAFLHHASPRPPHMDSHQAADLG